MLFLPDLFGGLDKGEGRNLSEKGNVLEGIIG